MTENITVYDLEVSRFQMNTYTFRDKVNAVIYEDFWIDFKALEL